MERTWKPLRSLTFKRAAGLTESKPRSSSKGIVRGTRRPLGRSQQPPDGALIESKLLHNPQLLDLLNINHECCARHGVCQQWLAGSMFRSEGCAARLRNYFRLFLGYFQTVRCSSRSHLGHWKTWISVSLVAERVRCRGISSRTNTSEVPSNPAPTSAPTSHTLR